MLPCFVYYPVLRYPMLHCPMLCCPELCCPVLHCPCHAVQCVATLPRATLLRDVLLHAAVLCCPVLPKNEVTKSNHCVLLKIFESILLHHLAGPARATAISEVFDKVWAILVPPTQLGQQVLAPDKHTALSSLVGELLHSISSTQGPKFPSFIATLPYWGSQTPKPIRPLRGKR